jgi:sugar lactone lactonase YvrE
MNTPRSISYILAALSCLASPALAAPPEVTPETPYLYHDNAIVPVLRENEKPATLQYNENQLLLPGGNEEGMVGRAGSGTSQTVSNSYMGFKLPAIRGPVTSIKLKLRLNYRFGATGLALYIFAPDAGPRELKNDTSGKMHDPGTPADPSDDIEMTGIYGVHYYNTAATSTPVTDPRPTVRLIAEKFVTNVTATDGLVAEDFEFDLSTELQPGGKLADFYGPDGEPISKDGMIWFRLSPDHLASSGNRRLSIIQNKTSPYGPKLEIIYTHVPTASELPPPSDWPATDTDSRRQAVRENYLRLLDRKLDMQRAANVPQIEATLASGEVVSASVLEYAYAQAWRVSKTPHSPAGNAAISREAFIANACDALLAATNAMGSGNPDVVARQTAELARGLASLAGIYRCLSETEIAASTYALDDAAQTALAAKLGACADALLAQTNPDYGSYGRAASAAQGVAAVANLSKLASAPNRSAWLAYAGAVWNDWKHVNDTVESARASTGLWLHSIALLANELDAAAGSEVYANQLKDAAAIASISRHAAAIAPNGVLPDYGESDWDEGFGYWLHAFERLGYSHERADYFDAASSISAYLERNKSMAVADMAGLVEACRAITETPALTPETLPGVALTTRTDDQGDAHFDKIHMRTGGDPAAGASFVSLNLHDHGGNAGDDVGAISLYTSGSSVLLHGTGAGNTFANQQQNAWAAAGASAADLLATSGRIVANAPTRWLINHRWPGATTVSVNAAPPLDIASVSGFFLRIINTGASSETVSVSIESVIGVKSDGNEVQLQGAWSGSPNVAVGDTADIPVNGLSLNLSDYAYLFVKWQSSHPDLVASFGITGASLLPSGSPDGRPAGTTLLTAAGSRLFEATAQDDALAPKASLSRVMLDSAGRAITHHRDVRLRSIDGALFVLDTFEFAEAGDYTVGPVWHVQNIISSGASVFPGASVQVIARDDAQIDTADSKASSSPKQMQFDFGAASVVSETVTPATLAFASANHVSGRHPQSGHFAAAATGARAAGESITILTVIRANPPATDASDGITYDNRYANFVDLNGRVVVGMNPFPTIEVVTYPELTRGGTVTLQGINFASATEVKIGDVAVPAGQWTINDDTRITATVPMSIPDTGYITVTSPKGTGYSPSLYTIAAAPPARQVMVASQTVIAGKRLTLSASTEGNPPPACTWQVSKDGGATWETIESETSSILIVSNISASMDGWQYRYIIFNHAGSATSDASTLRIIKAWLSQPVALVIDQAGDIYVADSGLKTINRIDAGGRFARVSGTANSSSINGTRFSNPAGKYANPNGISITPMKLLLVSDAGSHNIYQFAPDKTHAGEALPVAIAGNAPVHNATVASGTGTLDATGTAARFTAPWGIVTDSEVGVSFVADSANHTIRMISYGHSVTTIAGKAGVPGTDGGIGGAARFNTPTALAYDQIAQVLYVADTGNHVIRIVDLAPGPNQYQVTLYAGAFEESGFADGASLDARFNAPQGLAVDGDTLLVADTNNSIIREIVSGTVTTIAGSAGKHAIIDATGTSARFDHPSGLAMDANGILWVADSGNATLRKITVNDEVTTPQWTDIYKVDPPPPSNEGTLNGDLDGGGGGGGALSLWVILAFGLLCSVRRACARKHRF